ncbi:eEF1A lysine and N-terminal methyltransferase homolog [Chelonus insularis]|uniref:eEF1A lysine and N-terminal methyltransferase homolog n=1 Tax=Chelonus insularis TaxID=460826 RepID=UPI00158BFEFC|nr:eEF1A lysine and N-terminal methyltransferase homolog [Chelonus insularis]
MNLLPKSNEEFSKEQYWNKFFKKRDKKAFEWYGEYPELCELLSKYIKFKDDILMVGCGNSTLSMDLYDVGYKSITNIDISQVVIDQMKEKNRIDRSELIFEKMDAMNMTFEDNKFSVVMDKGTLDALMPNNNEETINNIDQYFREISRVLRKGGRYICISLLQEHILNKLAAYFPTSGFMFRIIRCHDVENKMSEKDNDMFPVFLIVATKCPGLNQQVLELSLTNNYIKKVSSIDEMVKSILTIQQSNLVCNRLRCKNIADEGEVMLELFSPEKENPRYIIYVLDQPKTEGKSYVVFLVPQGREGDWLFSTKEGRTQFATMIDKDRIAITMLGRNHNFVDWEEVKNELNTFVKKLAPPRLPSNSLIAYLSLGPDVGNREILYEGESKMNGRIVVENVYNNDCDFKSRRLIFLNNQFVIQSDAQIKSIKTRRGKCKEIINHEYLACEHHALMSIAVNAIVNNFKNDNKNHFKEILIVGLGGGGLCMFLHRFFPQLKITAVEIDEMIFKVAKDWFDFTVNDQVKVEIDDGIKYLDTIKRRKNKLHAILFDVNSNDSSLGMSCPPKDFLEPSVLCNISECLCENGVLILNLVCRDKNLRPPVLTTLKTKFSSIASIKLKNCVNEILICSIMKQNSDKWKQQLLKSFENFLNELVSKKLSINDSIETSEFSESLTIES